MKRVVVGSSKCPKKYLEDYPRNPFWNALKIIFFRIPKKEKLVYSS
ncbi:MAG: hypothetical protein HPY63_03805 [Methanobacteriaceae archaeon]|nr:hypothetical protein [Methanobacteriaceae archaeon]